MPLKGNLKWDADKEQCPNDPEAKRTLSRAFARALALVSDTL